MQAITPLTSNPIGISPYTVRSGAALITPHSRHASIRGFRLDLVFSVHSSTGAHWPITTSGGRSQKSICAQKRMLGQLNESSAKIPSRAVSIVVLRPSSKIPYLTQQVTPS